MARNNTISLESRSKQFYFYCATLGHCEDLKKHTAHFNLYSKKEKESVIKTGFLNACQAGNLDAVEILLSDKFYRAHSQKENIEVLYSGLHLMLANINTETDTRFAVLDYILYKSPFQLSTKTAHKSYVERNNSLFENLCAMMRAQHFCAIDYLANYIEKHRQDNTDGSKYNLLKDTNYEGFKKAWLAGHYDIAEGLIKRYAITGREPAIKKFLVDYGEFFLMPDSENLKSLMAANFDKQLLTKELRESMTEVIGRVHKI